MKKKSLVLFVIISMGLWLASTSGPSWGQETPAADPRGDGAVDTTMFWRWVPATGLDAGITTGDVPPGWQPVLVGEKTFAAGRDNTLFEDVGGNLSEGAGPKIFVGQTRQLPGIAIRRGLIYFDLANSGIPADAPITKVTLRLHVSDSNTGPQTITLRRLLKNWGEGISFSNGTGGIATTGDATWLHTFFPTEASKWATKGGDFSPVDSAGALVGGKGSYSAWSARRMIADVTDWLDTPANNFGWLLQGNESVRGTAKGFDSRQGPTPEFQPVLIIEYQPALNSYYFPAVFK